MTGDNWLLVTDELVEFEKHPAEVQDFQKSLTKGVYGIHPILIKKNQKMSTMQPVGLEDTRISTSYGQSKISLDTDAVTLECTKIESTIQIRRWEMWDPVSWGHKCHMLTTTKRGRTTQLPLTQAFIGHDAIYMC